MYLSPFFSLSFSRSCRTRRRLIVANGPSSWRHERGNGIKPRRAARDLLIVTTSCRGAARRRASGRDSNSSQDSYIMCVHRVDSLFFRLLSFRFPYLFIGYRSPLIRRLNCFANRKFLHTRDVHETYFLGLELPTSIEESRE